LKLLASTDAATLLAAHHIWTSIQQVLRVSIEGDFDEAALPGRLGEVLAHAAGVADFATLKAAMESHASATLAIYERLLAPPRAKRLRSRETEEESP
jgi:hypothetical protein